MERNLSVSLIYIQFKFQKALAPTCGILLDAGEADPSHLGMVAAAPAAATVLTYEGAEAAAAMEDAKHLVNFQLVPKVAPPVSNLPNQHMCCC